ncbi:MAG: D-2-hydroxyacid dehydrogenase [Alphaproteobacteria bacterium]|nr:D-2-hydroxyacid dehydrogenase [Alphaproteobacteria bacterium]
MKLLIHRGALKRVEHELAATGLKLDLIVVDENGVWHGDQKIEAKNAAPDVAWVSIDVFITRQMPVFFEAILSAGTTRWMQTFNAGLDLPIFKDILAKGVRLSNSDAQAVPIAEYVVAHALAELHPIAAQRAAQAERKWRTIPFREISQTSWLIIGYGHIGQEVARRAKAFGARVVGIRRSTASHEFADLVATQAELPKLLPDADVVVLSCALNDTTRDLANDTFFQAMKKESILINIARGGVVDEDALLAALARNAPRIAVLDVFKKEPLPETSPFWAHPQVRVTAHTSAAGSGTVPRGDQLFLNNLKRYAAGQPLINEVAAASL